jgi:hypothetical protein
VKVSRNFAGESLKVQTKFIDFFVLIPQMTNSRARCYFDVTLNSLSLGRIVFELYNDLSPKTCENFRALCTGEKGVGKTTEKHLYYKVSRHPH